MSSATGTAKPTAVNCWCIKNLEGWRWASTRFIHGSAKHTDTGETEGLKQALNKYGFDAVRRRARRDEEKSRAKERIYSFRDRRTAGTRKTSVRSQAAPCRQINKGESIRVFPLSNWTELDIWQYIYSQILKSCRCIWPLSPVLSATVC